MSNKEFWNRKLDQNARRDRRNLVELERDGWSVLVIWECEVDNTSDVTKRLVSFLGNSKSTSTNPP